MKELTWITFLMLLYWVLLQYWRRDANRIVRDWCHRNGVVVDPETPLHFRMGRLAHASIVGCKAGLMYVFEFELKSGIFNLPRRILWVWRVITLLSQVEMPEV